MSLAVDFSKKSVVIVTGASRGIGSAIAINIAKHLHPSSVFLLLARTEQGLIYTYKEIKKINDNFTVKYEVIDFSKPDLELYETIMENFIKSINFTDVSYAYCFHNAGAVGTMKRALSLTNLDAWSNHFEMNLFSTVLLNSVFVNQLRSLAKQLVITNVTSAAAVAPFKNLAMYGAVKAARTLFFKVLAAEEPDCWVLNYAPGPVDTEMYNCVMESAESNEVRKLFSDVKKTAILSPGETAQKLLHILSEGAYKSGDIIDYYDI